MPLHQDGHIKTKTRTGRDVEEPDLHALLLRMQNGADTVETVRLLQSVTLRYPPENWKEMFKQKHRQGKMKAAQMAIHE